MESKRILLRQWHEEDAEALFRLASDPEVGPRSGWMPHRSVEESRTVIRSIFHNGHTWAIEEHRLPGSGTIAGHQPDCTIVGCICYYPCGESNIEIGPDDAEVGYWVGHPYWNLGFATEALQLLVGYCFREKGFRTLWADHLESNPASGRVLTKCGFRDTGRVNRLSHLPFGSDSPVLIWRLDNPC